MSTPILATKLYVPPPRPKIVPRPRLIARLNDGLVMGCKLTLISASAGFGKTTLVSEWIADPWHRPPGQVCGRQVAWLSLDEADSDPTRFLTYFVAALQTITANIGAGVLNVLQSPQPPSTESILTALLNEITTAPDNFSFVLDDYHTIDSKPVDHAITFLLEHLPPQMHLVIATREDPHLPLARLRARGQLTELRAADLRFTPEETAEFLNQVMGLTLSSEDIAALEIRTEGWIAGLQLAALSMQGHQDTAAFIQSFTGSNRFVLDYLIEEVLQQQTESVQAFLMRTSILERMCGQLCESVLGNPPGFGQSTLETLERDNLFIVPLDNERRWYRYHHLFGELLRQRLGQNLTPEEITELHTRASAWYEHNGLAAEAIRHALSAEDFERAANLIELAVPDMRRNRQGATVTELGWLKALPGELVRIRPVLSVDYAYALVGGGELEGVEAWLQNAERWLDKTADIHKQPGSPAAGMVVVDEEEFRRLPGMIALLRAAQALARGDMPETVKNARRALDLAPENAHLMLGGAASQLGLAAWTSGNLETARRMTADGMAHLRQAGYISAAIGCSITMADIQITQGRLYEAMTTYEQALLWATEPGAPILRGAADMYVGMSSLHYEHNDLDAALQLLLQSQALGELAGLQQNPYRWCAAMARIRQAQGDLDGALQLLEEAERVYDGNFSPNVRPVATRKVRVWLAQGRLGEALRWVREHGLSVDSELSYLREFDHITLARVFLAGHQHDRTDVSIDEIMKLLERLLKDAEEGGRKGCAIEILMLQALAYHIQGNLPAALLPLQRVLELAESEGYVRMFLDEGKNMMQLLREASANNIMPDYSDKLLESFKAEQREGKGQPDKAPAQPLIEPLSQRELEVLRLIAQGLSNQEICERLFLALDTVKGHNRRIFDKLQVQRRTEAIARARELGLI